MKIAILTIGNELMSGRTADTNSSFIAREANLQGWRVEAMMSVEDNFASIKSRLELSAGAGRCRYLHRRAGPDCRRHHHGSYCPGLWSAAI